MSGKKPARRVNATKAKAATKANAATKAKPVRAKQEDVSDDSASDSDARSVVEELDADFELEAVDADDDVEVDDDADDDVEVDDADADDEEDVDDDEEDVDADDDADTQKRINEFDFIYSKGEDAPSREIIVVKGKNRVTSHMLSKTEITEAVSIRCAQIQKNPIVFVDIEGISDPIVMAKKEINERKCPLMLRRFIGHYNSRDYYEYWDINEMSRPFVYEL